MLHLPGIVVNFLQACGEAGERALENFPAADKPMIAFFFELNIERHRHMRRLHRAAMSAAWRSVSGPRVMIVTSLSGSSPMERRPTRAARSPVAPKELTPTLLPLSADALAMSRRDISACITREKSNVRFLTGTPRIAPRSCRCCSYSRYRRACRMADDDFVLGAPTR